MGMGLLRLIALLTAAGTALTNSTTETVLASATIPANSLAAGKAYEIAGQVRATATNGTDTLRVRVRIGPTTLTGTVVYDSTAVDVANDDGCSFDLKLTVRSIGAAGEVAITGFGTIMGAEGTATARLSFERVTSLATSSDLRVEVTGVWSVANAGNSCQAEAFRIVELA